MLPRRKTLRLKHFDYAQNGAYFVTICTHGKRYLFGSVVQGQMRLNPAGQMVLAQLQSVAEQYANSEITYSVVMPNHLHFIWVNQDDVPLADVVRLFKGRCAAAYRRYLQEQGLLFQPLWQRSFYEHVIRDEQDYLRIAEYIENNPLKWELDCFYSG